MQHMYAATIKIIIIFIINVFINVNNNIINIYIINNNIMIFIRIFMQVL